MAFVSIPCSSNPKLALLSPDSISRRYIHWIAEDCMWAALILPMRALVYARRGVKIFIRNLQVISVLGVTTQWIACYVNLLCFAVNHLGLPGWSFFKEENITLVCCVSLVINIINIWFKFCPNHLNSWSPIHGQDLSCSSGRIVHTVLINKQSALSQLERK